MSSVDTREPASSTSRVHEDLDPAAFLKSVRELSEKREREDAERYRKLEEEVEKSRAERVARRAERARSISPEKPDHPFFDTSTDSRRAEPNGKIASPSPMTPPPTSIFTMDNSAANPPSPTKDVPEFKGFGSRRRPAAPSTSASPMQAIETPPPPSPSASSLARSGTLSWQRRPASRGGSRPQSVAGSDPGVHATNASTNESEPSRDQIAASLGSRDPSWFRQTADRGTSSAAYRRSKEVGTPSEIAGSGRRGLPGLSREASVTEPARQSSPVPSESVKSETPSRFDSVRDSGLSSGGFSAATSTTSTSRKPDLNALIAADEGQHEASPLSDKASSTTGDQSDLGRTPSMSSSQARLAGTTERPSSPTKGMGGFVQSALMKRSDSVSKRWSAQPGVSLGRQNSAASVRAGYGGLQGSHSMPRLEPNPPSREASNEALSRPTSSSSNLTNLAFPPGREERDVFVKPALPYHSRSKSVASIYGTTGEDGNATSPPSSPSKRWSPTKSSWIESALTRPDSPKPAAPKNAQPSWMENLAKAKAQRASAESTPRGGTPKPAEDEQSRPSSPTKTAPFGQSILKRSESRDLAASLSSSSSFTPPVSTKPTAPKALPAISKEEVITPSSAKDAAAAVTPHNSALDATPKGVTATSVEDAEAAIPQPEPASVIKGSGQAPTDSTEQAKKDQPSPQRPVVDTVKPKVTSTIAPKPKPETPPKPATDFRSTLRSRAPPERKQDDTPEFLSRFGNLKKAQTEKFVAPDVFKNNITRGKAELYKTGGPVKPVRRDELKESLLAKKDEWKKAKEEGRELPGQVHERKTSGPPLTASKPEALAKREVLGKSDSTATTSRSEKADEPVPEALAKHRSLKDEPQAEAPTEQQPASLVTSQTSLDRLSKQTSAPAFLEHKQPNQSSGIASRFNSGLASILARGPPATTNGSSAPSRSESPAVSDRSTIHTSSAPSEPAADGAPLQDMRKGRARGPKKRKPGASAPGTPALEQLPEQLDPEPEVGADREVESSAPVHAVKPQVPPGSAESVMMASLPSRTRTTDDRAEVSKPALSEASPMNLTTRPQDEKPATPIKSPAAFPKPFSMPGRGMDTAPHTPKNDAPTFSSFGSTNKPTVAAPADDNKENTNNTLPSVKTAASFWGRQAPPQQTGAPSQIQLPSKRDEEAAMRSAGLLASSPSRPSSANSLGMSVEKNSRQISTPPTPAGLPPKPAKSSRVVSGQLQEASPNKGNTRTVSRPSTEADRLLTVMFGVMPSYEQPLMIETRTVMTNCHEDTGLAAKTLRKNIQEVLSDGSLRPLAQQEEYSLFDEAVYVCTHVSTPTAGSAKRAQTFVWAGDAASKSTIEQAQLVARRLGREAGSVSIVTCQQGYETPDFLQALGGIMVTRRGSRKGAPKQYMLCGRKHLGHITFDEMDLSVKSLCPGFVYLVSYPVTLQQTKLYLWKGSACSTEEVSAARLTAMDLSETGEIIEVDDGAEFASFLKVFGPGTTKSSVPKTSPFWRAKGQAPEDFAVRLFRIQQAEAKTSMITSLFTRRPSWNKFSPSRSPSRPAEEVKVEAKHISPFTQSDLDADGIYLLDAHSELYVLVGPLLASQPENVRNALLGQTLLFAAEYAGVCAEERGGREPQGSVLFRGVPEEFALLFRHWSQEEGLWGTASLMAGSRQAHGSTEVKMLPLEEVRKAVCTL